MDNPCKVFSFPLPSTIHRCSYRVSKIQIPMKMHRYWFSTAFTLLMSFAVQAAQDPQEGNTFGKALQGRDEEEATEVYVIYAEDVSVKSQADAINELLDKIVIDKSTIYASEVNDKVNGKDMWTLFWGASLTASQAETIRANPNVSNDPS